MPFPDHIDTKRLSLRPYEVADMDAHVAILGDWNVTRWLSRNIPFPYGPEDGAAFLAEATRDFAARTSLRYAMRDKETGRHMGGIRIFSLTPESEIGYWMHPDFWGRGRGTEVLRAVIRTGFAEGVIQRFVAQTAAGNKGSRRILEKVGFSHAGTPPPDYARCGHSEGCSEFYRLDRADFPARPEEDV